MTDRFVVRTVVVGLGSLVLACVVAAVVLALHGNDLPEFLKYVGTTALGAFAGVLSKTGTEVQPVAVVDQPVATVDVPSKRKRGDRGEAIGLLWILVILILVAILIGALR